MSKVDAEPLNKMKVIEREVLLDDITKNLLVRLKIPLTCWSSKDQFTYFKA